MARLRVGCPERRTQGRRMRPVGLSSAGSASFASLVVGVGGCRGELVVGGATYDTPGYHIRPGNPRRTRCRIRSSPQRIRSARRPARRRYRAVTRRGGHLALPRRSFPSPFVVSFLRRVLVSVRNSLLARLLRWVAVRPPPERIRYRIPRKPDPQSVAAGVAAFQSDGAWTEIHLICDTLWAGFTVSELTRDHFRRWHRRCWVLANRLSTPHLQSLATEFYHKEFQEILRRMNEMGFWLDEKLPDPSDYAHGND